jgi:hypothetical protein
LPYCLRVSVRCPGALQNSTKVSVYITSGVDGVGSLPPDKCVWWGGGGDGRCPLLCTCLLRPIVPPEGSLSVLLRRPHPAPPAVCRMHACACLCVCPHPTPTSTTRSVRCEFSKRGFDLVVLGLRGQDLRLLRTNLAGDVDAKGSKVIVKADRLTIVLKKKEVGARGWRGGSPPPWGGPRWAPHRGVDCVGGGGGG